MAEIKSAKLISSKALEQLKADIFSSLESLIGEREKASAILQNIQRSQLNAKIIHESLNENRFNINDFADRVENIRAISSELNNMQGQLTSFFTNFLIQKSQMPNNDNAQFADIPDKNDDGLGRILNNNNAQFADIPDKNDDVQLGQMLDRSRKSLDSSALIIDKNGSFILDNLKKSREINEVSLSTSLELVQLIECVNREVEGLLHNSKNTIEILEKALYLMINILPLFQISIVDSSKTATEKSEGENG